MDSAKEATSRAVLARAQQLLPVFCGRLAQNLLEDTVKVRQRLEPHLEGNLAHPQVRVEQQVLRLLDAHAGQVVGEVDAGHLLEQLAEVEGAGVDGFGDVAEAQVLGLVLYAS